MHCIYSLDRSHGGLHRFRRDENQVHAGVQSREAVRSQSSVQKRQVGRQLREAGEADERDVELTHAAREHEQVRQAASEGLNVTSKLKYTEGLKTGEFLGIVCPWRSLRNASPSKVTP